MQAVNPRSNWRHVVIDESLEARQRIENFGRHLVDNADYRIPSEDAEAKTAEQTGDVCKPPSDTAAEPPNPIDCELETLLLLPKNPPDKTPPIKRVLCALDIARGDCPVDMYNFNRDILGDGNPTIWPLGQYPFGDSITTTEDNYYMYHHRSQRCARDHNFVAMLADQLRRAQSARATSATFRNDPESLRALNQLLTSPEAFAKRTPLQGTET